MCRALVWEFSKESQQKDENFEHIHIFPFLPKEQMKNPEQVNSMTVKNAPPLK